MPEQILSEEQRRRSPNVAKRLDKNRRALMIRRLNPYGKLRRAYELNRGTNLSANDVNELLRDSAIYDVIMEAQPEDPEF